MTCMGFLVTLALFKLRVLGFWQKLEGESNAVVSTQRLLNKGFYNENISRILLDFLKKKILDIP